MRSIATEFPYRIFRAYDVRGCLSVFTPVVMYSTAYALLKTYKDAGVNALVLGFDARLSSPYYAEIMQQVAAELGLKLICIGCCASPMLYFHARRYAGNGIMITASHNPKSDNGLKWLMHGQPPSEADIQQLGLHAAAHFNSSNNSDSSSSHNSSLGGDATATQIQPASTDFARSDRSTGTQATEHLRQTSAVYAQNSEYHLAYEQACIADIHLQRPFKIVLDGMHGAAGQCAFKVLQKLGCEVTALRCHPNGEFPEHAPDPSYAAHLQQLQASIVQQQADVGIALDGDGDRLVMLDHLGKMISPDRLISLCAKMCLQQHPQHEVVFDVKCSRMVKHSIETNGGIAIMLRTGSSFLRRYLFQSAGRAVFAGEYAGHYMFNDGRGLGYDDGLYAALRILEYWSQQAPQPLVQLMAQFPVRAQTDDCYIATRQHQPQQVLAQLCLNSAALAAELTQIDGVRLDFNSEQLDGFAIMRASNTSDYFTLRFEARNTAQLAHIQNSFVQLLVAHYPDIAQDIQQIQVG